MLQKFYSLSGGANRNNKLMREEPRLRCVHPL